VQNLDESIKFFCKKLTPCWVRLNIIFFFDAFGGGVMLCFRQWCYVVCLAVVLCRLFGTGVVSVVLLRDFTNLSNQNILSMQHKIQKNQN